MSDTGYERSSMESAKSSTPSHIARDLGVTSPTSDAGRSSQFRNIKSPSQAQNQISPNSNITSPSLISAASVSSSPMQTSESPAISQQPQQQPVLQQVSHHASQMREHDQQQRALYQQYLKRSPASPPEQSSTNLWSSTGGPSSVATSPKSGQTLTLPSPSSAPGSATSTGSGSHRARPGSLILSAASGPDGHSFVVSELSVMRVFAGQNLHSEATFKTVLLNSSTTAKELVSQAIQRFRLGGGGEDHSEYHLAIKQVEGSSTVLSADERPLAVFEQLVETSLEVPKVKRSSVGSISFVASSLSQHPAIKIYP